MKRQSLVLLAVAFIAAGAVAVVTVGGIVVATVVITVVGALVTAVVGTGVRVLKPINGFISWSRMPAPEV